MCLNTNLSKIQTTLLAKESSCATLHSILILQNSSILILQHCEYSVNLYLLTTKYFKQADTAAEKETELESNKMADMTAEKNELAGQINKLKQDSGHKTKTIASLKWRLQVCKIKEINPRPGM